MLKSANATIVANEEPNAGGAGEGVHESIGTIFSGKITSSAITSDSVTADGQIHCSGISCEPISCAPISSSSISSTTITTPYTQFANAASDGAEAKIGLVLEERAGVLAVRELIAGGVAAAHGQISVGDILRTINGDKVRTLHEAQDMLNGKDTECVVMVLERLGQGSPLFVEVSLACQ